MFSLAKKSRYKSLSLVVPSKRIGPELDSGMDFYEHFLAALG